VSAARVALVTGGAQGMGRSHVLGLARAGFTVVALDRDATAGRTAEAAARAESLEVHACVADACDEAAVGDAVRGVRERFGRVDVLVNNAGGALSGKALAETTMAEWDDTLRLNLTSQFLCIRAVVPLMIVQGGGRIINIASASVFSGITASLYRGDEGANLVPYVAAKGGVFGLTTALARELGRGNITVNAVAPGFTPTERVRARFPAEAIDRMVADQALQRVQEADDATGAVVFLASDGGAFVTGQVIRVDGGASMG
jgi:NAD(P)-dependent dehydrogenase (short-subunit alcohol dehydrogenase family)